MVEKLENKGKEIMGNNNKKGENIMNNEIKSKEDAIIREKIFIYLGNTIDAIDEDLVIPECVDCIQRLLNMVHTNENLDKTEIEDILIHLELIRDAYKYVKRKCEEIQEKVGPYPDEKIMDKYGYSYEEIYDQAFE